MMGLFKKKTEQKKLDEEKKRSGRIAKRVDILTNI